MEPDFNALKRPYLIQTGKRLGGKQQDEEQEKPFFLEQKKIDITWLRLFFNY